MAKLKSHFKIDYSHAKSRDASIFKGQRYRITILSDILVRIEYNENGIFEDRPTELAWNRDFEVPLMSVKQDDIHLEISTKYFKLEYNKESSLNPKKTSEKNLRIHLANTDKTWYINHPEARNFFGSEVSLDNAGGKIPLLKGLFSTDGFVSIDDSPSLIFNEDGTLFKNNESRVDIYVFMYRKDFGYCLRDYYLLSGQPPLIPRYALGVWWHRNVVYDVKSLTNLIADFKHHKIPLSVLLLGEDWHIRNVNKYQNLSTGYSFNRELFPDPEKFISYLHDQKIQLGLKIDPSQGIMNHEEQYASFLNESGLPNQQTPIPFNLFDENFLNAYFTTMIDSLHQKGVDFFWIDYYNRSSLASLRALNHYFYQNFNHDNKRGMILSRNGLTGSHRYPILYSGQTLVSWKMLKFLPYFNSNAANVGLEWWSHDIGGYKDGIEDGELYMRYAQFGTFSPIFRFSAKEGKYYKREPWAWEVKIESIVRDFMRLRHRLIPYIYSEGYKYYKTGMPYIRPLYYRYPETYDDPAYQNEYFFGSELFIAPITNKVDPLMKRVVERTFIPNETWYEFKSGKKIPGGKKYVLFYSEEDYPVFARSGAIIPMAILNDDDLNNTDNPEGLEIHVFPGTNNSYKLYEDDGKTTLYKEGKYLITEINYDYKPNNYTVIIKPTEGTIDVVPAKRTYKVRFRNTKLAQFITVKVGETEIKAPTYVDGKDLVIEIPFVPSSQTVFINCHDNDIAIDGFRLINEDIDSIINDLLIDTNLKEKIAAILFGSEEISKKRIAIRKLGKEGLPPLFSKLFIRLLEYVGNI